LPCEIYVETRRGHIEALLRTPMHTESYGSYEMPELDIEISANASCFKHGWRDTLKTLIRKGANINTASKEGANLTTQSNYPVLEIVDSEGRSCKI
jgi:hypothetical protein